MHSAAFSLLLMVAAIYETNGYKILVVSPIPGKSHAILGEGIVESLANAGHEVTYVTVYVPEKPIPRITIVDLSDNVKYFPKDVVNIQKVLDKTTIDNNLFDVFPLLMNISRNTLIHPNLQKLVNDKSQKFDAVLAEWMFSEVYVGFAAIFKCPLIWLSTIDPHWMVLELVDEVPNPAYTVHILSENIPPLSFTQRVSELASQITGRLFKKFWITGLEQELYDECFVPIIRSRHNTVPSFETLRYNASLVLSNSHLSMGSPTRLPPNFIPIGGYHIKPNVKSLPEDLQKLMDNAKNGVIYYSMGSNLRSTDFPDVLKKDLLKTFSKFKQTVIWKFEEKLPNAPSNVHIVKWAPQQSILAHKNCILFITHGGLLSTTESVHFGVPTIGIPVFADQFINVNRAVNKGYAQKVDLSYSMAEDIEKAIKNFLSNPKSTNLRIQILRTVGDSDVPCITLHFASRYTARVKELSQIYHDRPVPPAKELVHWVEHVIKTKGAPHLRSPAFLVPWYQKLYLDLILVLLVFYFLLKLVFIYIINNLFNKRKEKLN